MQSKKSVIIATRTLLANPQIKLIPPIGLKILATHLFSAIKNEPNNLEFWYEVADKFLKMKSNDYFVCSNMAKNRTSFDSSATQPPHFDVSYWNNKDPYHANDSDDDDFPIRKKNPDDKFDPFSDLNSDSFSDPFGFRDLP